MYRFADAVPNAEGVNTAISTSWDVKFSQVYIIHAPQQVAADGKGPATATIPSR